MTANCPVTSVGDSLFQLLDIQGDPNYLQPMRDGVYRQREPLPDGLRRSVLRRDRFTCCECRMAFDSLPLQVDHLIPVSAGGSDRTDNLRALCEPCNIQKLDLYTIHVASYRPRLIVSFCYDCHPPESISGYLTSRVFCATCRRLKTLHPDDSEDRELAKYFKRA